jgi:hypothetical protein
MTAGGNSKGGGNREQEISTISRNLKAAKELLGVLRAPSIEALGSIGAWLGSGAVRRDCG